MGFTILFAQFPRRHSKFDGTRENRTYLLCRAGRAALSGQRHRVGAHRRGALHRRRRHHAREARVTGGAVAPAGPAGLPRPRLRVRARLADLVAGRVGAAGFHIVASLLRVTQRL